MVATDLVRHPGAPPMAPSQHPSPTGPRAGHRSSWWGDRGVRTKVLAAVGVASVAATGMGVFGVLALGNAATTTEELSAGNMAAVVALDDMVDDVQNLRVTSRNAILATTADDTQAAFAKIPDLIQQYQTAQAAYVATVLTADE